MKINFDPKISIHKVFENQVGLTPQKTAVVDNKISLSYKELDNKANLLANFLVGTGIKKDKPVGVFLNRNADIAIAVLGILKAGGVFMPLDTHSPQLRLEKIIRDSGISHIISHQELEERLSSFKSDIFFIDDVDLLKEYSCNAPDVLVSPDDLAYLIHTSGTSGEPKGVLMEHKALSNLVLWHQHVLKDKGLITLGFSSFSFDVFTQELFSTCCSGGALHIVTDKLRLLPDKLVSYVVKQRVERVIMPFTPLQYFIKEALDGDYDLKFLKIIITAGEPLVITGLFREFFSKYPNCQLKNQYGLTEVHTVTNYDFTGSSEKWPEKPPVGKTIDNTKIYILNDKLQPVVTDEYGEIYVGGISVTRGFLNRSDLTKTKILLDPFSSKKNSRMYKTGDLGKFLTDGNLVCLGRKDTQIKIRGFRVELSEIEMTLLQHPGIKFAAAQVFESEHGKQQLVMYFVSNQEKNPSIFELRTFLGLRLPDYMVPHNFVELGKLPVNKNGKLDREALPKPGNYTSASDYIEPRNDIEKTLVLIWQEVLKVKKIGIKDDFFVMGGDSLLAAQLIIKVEAKFDIEISLIDIYQKPNILNISSMMERKIKEREELESIELSALMDEIESMTDEEIESLLNNE